MQTQQLQPIRIALVDDQVIVREGLRLLLEYQSGLEVVGCAAICQDAVVLAEHEQPDIVLLDLDLGGASGLDCLPQLLPVAPNAKVLILTGVYDLDVHHAAVKGGAMGIVRKLEAADVLVKAIRKVAAGEVWLDGMLMARVLSDLWQMHQQSTSPALSEKERQVAEMWRPKNRPQDDDEAVKIASLTEREREVVALIGEGLRNQQVADRLSISVITVRHHLSSIFSKLQVDDRFELAIYAYRHGLAKPPM